MLWFFIVILDRVNSVLWVVLVFSVCIVLFMVFRYCGMLKWVVLLRLIISMCGVVMFGRLCSRVVVLVLLDRLLCWVRVVRWLLLVVFRVCVVGVRVWLVYVLIIR